MPHGFALAYGAQSVSFSCGPGADFYTAQDPVKKANAQRFAQALSAFMNRADLDLAKPAVVVADKTRLCGYPLYLPVLVENLIAHGARPEAITLYIAYGTHSPQSDAESEKSYGPCFNQYRWVHHQCEGDHFKALGATPSGTPVRIRTDLAEASCVITFGAISHHYFAGYGGGRKLLFPGLGNKRAIYANHGLFLDRDTRALAPGCRPGQLEGNPLAEDLEDYGSLFSADMAIHGILNSHGEVCDLLVGKGRDHFREACAQHAACCEIDVSRPYDLVVASCGGFPKDINFIQSHKTIHHAADWVRDGGRLIVLSECRDGIGSQTFLPWFELGGWDAAFDALARRYEGNGGTALAMMNKTRRIKISLVTALPPSLAGMIGVECVSADHVQTIINRHDGDMAVIPNGGMLVRKTS
jgi:nickel-dependent lactate racemase